MHEGMAGRLSALRKADQFRELTHPVGIQLGSNDYLGLAGHARLQQAITRALEEDSRFAATGSRLLSGNHQRWEQLESEFAEYVGAEAALYFSSGYNANIGLLSSVINPEDTVFSDAANHASLIDGIRLARAKRVIVPHLDLNRLEDALRQESGPGQKVIVIESIFSMEGDRAPVDDLVNLCESFDAYLIVDEAHAIGVEGEAGRGLAYRIANHRCLLARVHTCGKALASMGAFVAGSRTLRDFLINSARPFIFTTALPPYCAAHVREGLVLAAEAESARTHLRQLGDYLRARLRAAGFAAGTSSSQIVPLILGANDISLRFAAALKVAGFAIRAIRPPTVPPGTARLRFSLNAKLSNSDIDALVSALAAVRETETVPE
jgi:8-amino-7-oxononanoate synthase